MSSIWHKWLYFNVNMLCRHLGTAGLATVATLYADGHWNLEKFLFGLLAGTVFPTFFTILQRGLPNVFDQGRVCDDDSGIGKD